MSNQQTTDKKVIKNEVFGVYFDTGSTKQLVAITDSVSKAESFISDQEKTNPEELTGLFSWRNLGFNVVVVMEVSN